MIPSFRVLLSLPPDRALASLQATIAGFQRAWGVPPARLVCADRVQFAVALGIHPELLPTAPATALAEFQGIPVIEEPTLPAGCVALDSAGVPD